MRTRHEVSVFAHPLVFCLGGGEEGVYSIIMKVRPGPGGSSGKCEYSHLQNLRLAVRDSVQDLKVL